MKLLSFPLSEKVYIVFPFYFWRIIFLDIEFYNGGFFSFQHFKYFTSFSCLHDFWLEPCPFLSLYLYVFFSSCLFQDFPFVFFFFTYWFLCCFGVIYQEVCVYAYFILLDILWASWICSLLSVTSFGTFWLLLLEVFPCSLSTFQCFNKVCVPPLDIMSHFLDVVFCFCFHDFFPPFHISLEKFYRPIFKFTDSFFVSVASTHESITRFFISFTKVNFSFFTIAFWFFLRIYRSACVTHPFLQIVYFFH